MGSIYADNAAAAVAAHADYFGESVEYRQGPTCDWSTITNCVLHGEEIRHQRRGEKWAKVIRRNAFCSAAAVSGKINAQLRVGGQWGDVYTVTDVTFRGTRAQLHLARAEVVEVTRPGYRIGG
jgi:hypothetical protein